MIRNIPDKPVPVTTSPARAAPAQTAASTSGSTAPPGPGVASPAALCPGAGADSVNAGGRPSAPAKTAAATPDQATACFIAELSASLVELARAHHFETLAYLFDLAALEAQSLAGTPNVPGRECRQAASQ